MTGHESLLTLAAALRKTSPHVRDAFDLRLGSHLMERAAEVIERLAPCEPDIYVVKGEE